LALLDEEEVFGAEGVGAGCEVLGAGWYCGEEEGFAPLDQGETFGASTAGRRGAVAGAVPLRLNVEGGCVLIGAMGAC
jgi:hypothetical protein